MIDTYLDLAIKLFGPRYRELPPSGYYFFDVGVLYNAATREITIGTTVVYMHEFVDEMKLRHNNGGGNGRAVITQIIAEKKACNSESEPTTTPPDPAAEPEPLPDITSGNAESVDPISGTVDHLRDEAAAVAKGFEGLDWRDDLGAGITAPPRTKLTAQELLTANGIHLKNYNPGNHTSVCPKCSHDRKKKRTKCLSIRIDDDGACWHCHHCGWIGPEKDQQRTNNPIIEPSPEPKPEPEPSPESEPEPEPSPEPEPEPEPSPEPAPAGRIYYVYHTADGTPAFRKVRAYDKNGEKTFWIERPDPNHPGQWIKGTRDKDGNKLVDLSILYRLPEIIEAIANGHEIACVEGEKDADRLWSISIPATCSAHGAARPDQDPKWTIEHSQQLAGANIVVLGDHDAPGYAHQDATCKCSLGIAKRVRVFKLADHWPEIKEGGDVSDWLDAGHSREQLDELIEQAPDYGQPHLTLSLADWLARSLPPADLLLPWLSTTSRVLFAAPTGIGKTMVGIGLGMGIAAAAGFLHWRSVRPARVLFIDGEMSRRLLQQRLIDEVNRLGRKPDGFYVLSHEDVENFRPLNTPEGQAFIEEQIKRIGGVDLIEFDNVISLLAGNMKETEQWAATMPWVKSLTRRNIGQIWLHHTNEENKTYGDKTREWQMDTVILGEEVKRSDTDVSFQITFTKARERTPANRAAFADIKVALVDDHWTTEPVTTVVKAKLSPQAQKFFEALRDATIGNEANKMFGCPAASLEDWRAECVKRGLLDKGKDSARSLLSKYRLELITKNWIACNDTMAWILVPATTQPPYTRAIREQLQQCGISDREIAQFTSEQAQNIIRERLPKADYFEESR